MPSYSAAPGAPIWFDLMTSDVDRATEFYGSLFGWDCEEPTADFGGYRNFTINGSRVAGMMPMPGSETEPTNVWAVYFRSDDAAATTEAVGAAGGTVIVPPMPVGDMGTMAVYIDPAGGAFGAWQPGTHPGFVERGEVGTPYWFDEMSMDYAASTAFYPKVFGWDLEAVPNADGGPSGYSQVMIDGEGTAGIMDAAAMLGEGHPSFWQVYITVADVAATLAKATELGGSVLMPPDDTPYGVLAAFKDPMGAAICIATPPAEM
ncbi:VOC family protein [Gordonia sp. (in: high G+C Gram-positive bacteria)]|uniref:VOC family protein n=1 Tax=Gordonia sp. (in: high G+C Gram-positive bacteria) TaxID=84139 RepID=UPI00169B37F0|nr:VOC family protein [Gordonia sp. (in: high G+C Gram-positive bacteria)]NLG48040.1 VOC family protein [Gordonia sp. (in: high G+C Gram-positive bacteria)]